jgi:hypothetical protein
MSLLSKVLLLTIACLLATGLALLHSQPTALLQPPVADGQSAKAETAVLQAEINRLKGIVPDQSHAMADVGYHFANLWFAGDKKNWPLAKFYLDETRSHLKWAVRIIPVRKTSAGNLELQGILDAVDNTFLSEIGKSIDTKDSAKFVNTYKQTLEACYTCHKAAEKPYLRPQIPMTPPQPTINFDPEATWPQ